MSLPPLLPPPLLSPSSSAPGPGGSIYRLERLVSTAAKTPKLRRLPPTLRAPPALPNEPKEVVKRAFHGMFNPDFEERLTTALVLSPNSAGMLPVITCIDLKVWESSSVPKIPERLAAMGTPSRTYCGCTSDPRTCNLPFSSSTTPGTSFTMEDIVRCAGTSRLCCSDETSKTLEEDEES